MPSIRPVSDLRNHFAEITKEVQESREPVFLTKNGVGSIVVMSIFNMLIYEGGSSQTVWEMIENERANVLQLLTRKQKMEIA